MFVQKQSTREAPGIFSYMKLLSSRVLTYSIFFGTPIIISLIIMQIYYNQQLTEVNLFILMVQVTLIYHLTLKLIGQEIIQWDVGLNLIQL